VVLRPRTLSEQLLQLDRRHLAVPNLQVRVRQARHERREPRPEALLADVDTPEDFAAVKSEM